MKEQTAPDTSINMRRRQVLELAGACAAVGGIGARTARADACATGDVVEPLDVAIVGAGLAGLTAARDLRRAGCEA